jgi:hypothetical protein
MTSTTTIATILAILAVVTAIYYIFRNTKYIKEEPEKNFEKAKNNFNKIISKDISVQENNLNLSIMTSVLLGEKKILVSLSNNTPLFKKDLILNADTLNKDYNPTSKEFLIYSKRVTQTEANLDFYLSIWLTADGCIRYELKNFHE